MSFRSAHCHLLQRDVMQQIRDLINKRQENLSNKHSQILHIINQNIKQLPAQYCRPTAHILDQETLGIRLVWIPETKGSKVTFLYKYKTSPELHISLLIKAVRTWLWKLSNIFLFTKVLLTFVSTLCIFRSPFGSRYSISVSMKRKKKNVILDVHNILLMYIQPVIITKLTSKE